MRGLVVFLSGLLIFFGAGAYLCEVESWFSALGPIACMVLWTIVGFVVSWRACVAILLGAATFVAACSLGAEEDFVCAATFLVMGTWVILLVACDAEADIREIERRNPK